MKQTIALVDDDRNILTSVSMTLEQEGFQVRTYTDGESALQGITARPVDLAVLDINRASSWDEFRAAASQWGTPALNMLYADVEGNIGYQMVGQIPVRDGGEGLVPSPGWSGQYENQEHARKRLARHVLGEVGEWPVGGLQDNCVVTHPLLRRAHWRSYTPTLARGGQP